ncbi:MAG: transport permease protein [Phycisphaerae bacterium]|nr:MAG: ABC transporter permease [Planctomycetia bacterium]GJQ26614.1 MAG: transport permease protein [Phycisphaerae bacterium]
MVDATAMHRESFLLAWVALWRREVIRFLRQRSRVIGALGTPLVFWIILGAGLGRSLSVPGVDSMTYLEFSFPAALLTILMFTAIFSTFSIIEDRQAGFMQGVIVSPAPRHAIALGKVSGGVTLAVGQAALFLALAPMAGIALNAPRVVLTLAALTLVAFALTSFGAWLAWRMESTQGFHAVMNLLLMPMLVLSGGFFPAGGSATWLRATMAANPLSYCVGLLRASLYLGSDAPHAAPPGGISMSLAICAAFAAIMFHLFTRAVSRDSAAAVT